MVSALDSGSSSPGSSPGLGHCVVFLGKTLYSCCASLHPGVQMGTDEFNTGGNLAMDQHPIQGRGVGRRVERLVASCYRNLSNRLTNGPLDSCADLLNTLQVLSCSNLVIDTWFEKTFLCFLSLPRVIYIMQSSDQPTAVRFLLNLANKVGYTHNANMMNEKVAWLLSACVKRLRSLYGVTSGFRTRLLAITCLRGIRQEAQTQSFGHDALRDESLAIM